MDPEAVVERIRAGRLLEPGAPVVVLLSGGRDSVCLLDVAVRVAGAASVTALHVNYGLREEADEDERHCAGLCERLGAALVVERPAPLAGGGNVQAWAREARYAAAERLARERDDTASPAPGAGAPPAATIAAGHTADDQVETILYRLASSPSRRALLGMRPREGRLVRPLLDLTRAETTAYCEARGLAWRDDATNAGGRYARNRVRHGVVAALREIHPAAEWNILRLAEVLRDEADVLDALVAEQFEPLPGGGPRPAAADDSTTTSPSAPIGETGFEPATAGSRTGLAISLDHLAGLSPALRRLVVQRLADAAAGRPVPGAARRADQVAALRRHGTAWLDLGGGVRAVAEYGLVRAERAGAGEGQAPEPVALPVPGAVAFGGWRVACQETTAEPADGVLDRAALGGGELLVRAWRSGDRIAPVGLGGTKSLQDLFTARRIPRAARATVPVVVCGEEVAWVPGVATSARFAITPATRAAVRLTATPPR